MHKIMTSIFIFFSLWFNNVLSGQTIDPSFAPKFVQAAAGGKIITLPNNQLLISGGYRFVNDAPTKYLSRLHEDGTLDTTFQYDTTLSNAPQAFQLQADGKIVIAGGFRNEQGDFIGKIMRLLPDGQLDESFQIIEDSSLNFYRLTILPNQKIFVGYSRRVPNVTSNANAYGVRLYGKDGQKNTSFPDLEFTPDHTSSSSSSLGDIGVQSDNALIVGGTRLQLDTLTQDAFRLDSLGNIDTSFNPTIATFSNFVVRQLVIDDNGFMSFLGGGESYVTILDSLGQEVFASTQLNERTSIIATGRNSILAVGQRIMEVYYDGFTIVSPERGTNQFVSGLALQADGQLVAIGRFTEVFNRFTPGLFRFNLADLPANIVKDPTFKGGLYRSGTVRTIAVQPDGKIIAGGDFNFVNDQTVHHLVRLHADGTIDTTFNTANTTIASTINGIEQQAGGNLIVGGRYSQGGFGVPFNGLNLLDANGNNLRQIPFPYRGSGTRIAYLTSSPNGHVYAGEGLAYAFDGIGGQELTVYRALTPSSLTSSNYNAQYIDDLFRFNGLTTQLDNKLLIFGQEINYEGSDTTCIIRANVDGTRDTTFQPNLSTHLAATTAISIDTTTTFVGGFQFTPTFVFTAFLYKLDYSGKIDTSFNANFDFQNGKNTSVSSIKALPNGQLLVGGNFDMYNGEQVGASSIIIDQNGVFQGVFLPPYNHISISDVATIDENNIYIAGGFQLDEGPVGIAKIHLPTINKKDTIILTCYNDSLVTATPDTNFIYIDNRSIPVVDLSFDEETNVLKAVIFSNETNSAFLETPSGDTITFSDSLVFAIEIVGLYQVTVTNQENGCTGQSAIFVANNPTPPALLLDTAGQWNIYQPYPFRATSNNPVFNQRIDATAIYFFDGDTLINDIGYQKIYQTDQPSIDKQYAGNQYVGASREAGAKVYFIPPEASTEKILYDYDLTVGDTMLVQRFIFDFTEFVQVILESKDSVQTLDGEVRKRLNFSIYKPETDSIPRYFTSWIEGIGNIGIGGFLETHLDEIIFTGFYDLFNGEDYSSFFQCFSKENQVVYQSERFTECYTYPSYFPFPREDGIWRTLETRGDNFAPNVFGSTQKTRTYFMNEDTIINDQLYHKLYTTQAAIIPTQPNANQYIGAFREEGKVIYFQDKLTETERVLYDFNITVGDTIATIYDDIGTEYTIFLGKIDTVQTLDNQFRKRYELRIADNAVNNTLDFAFPVFTYWIEGIGDVHLGFLSFPESISPFEGKDDFQCFSEEDELIYQNPILADCYTDTASYSVEYTPLVVENATWVMINVEEEVTIDEWAYKIQGDTIVDGVTYKKLHYFECLNDDNLTIATPQLAAVLREDIAARKVYGRLFSYHSLDSCGFMSEGLLFDFDKAVGDDFSDCHTEDTEESTTVVKESIEFTYGQVRRVMTNGFETKLIEGIGYRDGLFIRPTSLVVPGYYTGLVGHKIDEDFSCDVPTSIIEQLTQKVNVFPNPTTNFLNLQLEAPIDAKIELISLAGQVVYATNFYDTQHRIEVGNIPKGIYFLHLQSEEGYLVRKVVVQ